MSDQSDRAPIKRSRYVVDTRLQWGFALPVLGIVLVMSGAYALAIYVLPGTSALTSLTAAETRDLFLHANLLYAGLTALLLVGVALLLAHRIAGPAVVIERAVKSLCRGEYEHRLSLRPGDQLHSLAGAVAELCGRLHDAEQRRERVLGEVYESLQHGDLAAARELLPQLVGPGEEVKEPPAPQRIH